jgi:hypothetical protein
MATLGPELGWCQSQAVRDGWVENWSVGVVLQWASSMGLRSSAAIVCLPSLVALLFLLLALG